MKVQIVQYKNILIGLVIMIVICVLTFNVVYFSSYYEILQINYINSLLLIPFILLRFSFEIFIEQNREKEVTLKIL